jgi:flavin-dependent dehydrogenase
VALGQPVDVVRREDFDADLVAQARARGVDIVEGEAVEAFDVDRAAGLVRVTTSRGRRLAARVLVGADGVGSGVRAALGARGRGARVPPLRLFKAELPAAVDLGARMVYDFSPMDEGLRGYVWLFPVAGGLVNVGAMHYPSRHLPGAAIERLLRRALARHGVTLAARARGWPAWRYDAAAPIAAPHLLCVGDAAGIDALTGEGIAVGLEQGLVAAAAIARALDRGDFAFARYGADVRAATVGRELAVDDLAAAILYAGGGGYPLALSMVMFDRGVQELYAARVSGSAVLADRKGALLAALARHALAAPQRLRRLRAALAAAPHAA